MIFGTKLPFILRSTGRSGYYKVVGETFIVSSHRFDDSDGFPLYMGAGEDAAQDWMEWDLEEQDIMLC